MFFELWFWRRLLIVPWTARRSNLSILKEISPEYSLEGLMLKLRLQNFGHLLWKANSLERQRAGEEGHNRDEMDEMTSRLHEGEFEQNPGDDEGQGSLACHTPWGHKESDMT